MFEKILIANRGEIACRVIKSARKLGIKTVAVYSDADKNALHVSMADEAVHIGPSPSSESYLQIDRIIAACKSTGAQAVHPGYGFLSENAEFSGKLKEAGIVFIGPPASAISAMGDKITSKKIASESGVSTVPGFMGIIADVDEAKRIAGEIGYPVMIKASAGGGGKGMRIAYNEGDVADGFQASKSEAASSFGDDRVFIEKYVVRPRHIEIQVLADSHGNCIYLGERECSIQRRNQKVIEEAPSPFLDPETRKKMGEQACDLARAVGYESAGTVEFIVDENKNFYFLEMNTRLQVEHPVTELVTGVDLVEEMLRVANGEKLKIRQEDVELNGWAFESRIYAEDPYKNFLPSIGRLAFYRPPEERFEADAVVRNDTGVYEGSDISIFYDPMIAKLCTYAKSREQALDLMAESLNRFTIEGVSHNIPFLSAIIRDKDFRLGEISTSFIADKYPDGFKGSDLSDEEVSSIASIAIAMFRLSEIRRTKVSGRMDNHERRVGNEWVVKIKDQTLAARISADHEGADVEIEGAGIFRVTGEWVPGQKMAEITVNDQPFIIQLAERVHGFRIRTRGADLNVDVLSKNVARFLDYIKDDAGQDVSDGLICPMPGLMMDVLVAKGDTVEEGQPLCVVEAMKMENILRAERSGKVKDVYVSKGQSVSVDDVIMDFE